jgi:hypothetical protein
MRRVLLQWTAVSLKRTAGAIVLALVVAVLTPSAHAAIHKDTRWGFKLKTPKGWKQAAMSATEEWIAAKFLGKQALEPKDTTKFWTRERPHIWVIAFPASRTDDRGAKVGKDKKGAVKITFKNPYKDYKDFVKRESSFVGGGYHFSKEEKGKVGDIEVMMYEIKVEKNARSPFRIVTWVYHFEDVDFAVQCKVLEDHYDKYKGTFKSTLKSLRRVVRDKAMPGAATTGKKIIEADDEEGMTPEEKQKSREEQFEQLLRKELEGLPKGWYQVRTEHYVALANADRKFTKRALGHAEAIRKYLDKKFPEVGSDYVPMGIIRVFASREEERAFQGGTNWMWARGAEQVLVTQTNGGTDRNWEFEYLSARLTSQYLSFKNSHLSSNMPYWFRAGLERHMKFARSKKSSIKIKPDEYDRQYIKDIIKQGKAIPLKDMFEKARAQDMTNYQAGSVCSYLLTKGDRGKTKGLVQDYLRNLIFAIEKAEAEFKAKQDKITEDLTQAAEAAIESGEIDGGGAESEDEEGESAQGEVSKQLWEDMQKAMKDRQKAILSEAFERTFGELSDKDWEKLDRAWRKYAG